MAHRFDWRKRSFDFKPKRALKDEEEFCKTDRAARYIQRAEQSPWARRHGHRKTAAGERRQIESRPRKEARGSRAAHEKPPWED
jgi:hypothetical protein